MSILDLLTQRSAACCMSKDVIYDFQVKDKEDEILFVWYVVDANHGYTVFSYQNPSNEDTLPVFQKFLRSKSEAPVFQKFFRSKSEAIEYAVDQGRAEKLTRGL